MKISLAAIPYYWPRQRVFDYYSGIAEAPVDVVYLGETVCAKRQELAFEGWLEIAEMLENAGKQVVISSLGLIASRADLQSLRRIVETTDHLIEANDIAMVQLLSKAQRPFVCSSNINIYNTQTLQMLHSQGMCRWVLPVELGADTLSDMLEQARALELDVETEVTGYGKLPLAYSARCFTARAHNRPKDKCQLACLEHPEGIPVDSQENQRLFTLNGIQTLSGQTQDLRADIAQMKGLGVDYFRVIPDVNVDSQFLRALQLTLDGAPLAPQTDPVCNGYWRGAAGMDLV